MRWFAKDEYTTRLLQTNLTQISLCSLVCCPLQPIMITDSHSERRFLLSCYIRIAFKVPYNQGMRNHLDLMDTKNEGQNFMMVSWNVTCHVYTALGTAYPEY